MISPFSTLDEQRKKLAYQRAGEKAHELESDATLRLAEVHEVVRRKTIEFTLDNSIPPVMQPFLQPMRYKGAHGGRGSAKSQTMGRLLLRAARKKRGLRAVCIREVQKSLEQSCKRLLEDLIQLYGVGAEFNVLKTQIETPGGGIIIFQGMQNHTAESVKSLEGYDIAWVEEAQSLSEHSLELLRPTMRKEGSEMWFSWNPDQVKDPIDQFLRHGNAPPDSIVLEVNFDQNPYFPETLRKEMEYDRSRDIDKYEHVWRGQYNKKSSSRVFKNWRIDDFEIPSDQQVFYLGGDWGFSVDPTVLICCYIIDRTLYVVYEAYQVGCEIEDIPHLFDTVGCKQEHDHKHPSTVCDGFARGYVITADSQRPDTISFVRRHGYPGIVEAKKGDGSVKDGIEFLKNYDIVVHSRCMHTIDELTHYSFKTDKQTNQILPVLEDKKNHVIDSLRYAVETLRIEEEDGVVW